MVMHSLSRKQLQKWRDLESNHAIFDLLIEQVITPFTRQKNSEAKARAEEVQKEIASLSVRLHAALVRGGLNRPR
jgi:hypothetical protein